jgi:transposase
VAAFHEVTVIEDSARRRSWSVEEKARIVAESLDPAVSVSAVAERHGLNPNQLYGWRRQFREAAEQRMAGCAPFADGGEEVAVSVSSMIEVVIGEITVRVGAGVEAAALKRVLRVVRSLS